jgi:hypothetical protein
MLPYATPADVQLALMDFDVIVQGNIATQLLVQAGQAGHGKPAPSPQPWKAAASAAASSSAPTTSTSVRSPTPSLIPLSGIDTVVPVAACG